MEEALTVDKLIEILTNLSKEGYGCSPVGIETSKDITCCLSASDVYHNDIYGAVIISTINI